MKHSFVRESLVAVTTPALLAASIVAASVACAVQPATSSAIPEINSASGGDTRGADRAAVERAVLDYVEGFYEGDTTRFVRSIWPEVRKYGYWQREPGGAYSGTALPYTEFMRIARSISADTPPDAPKDIVIFEVQDQTASAKLTAWWGTDYLLLAREEGR